MQGNERVYSIMEWAAAGRQCGLSLAQSMTLGEKLKGLTFQQGLEAILKEKSHTNDPHQTA